MTISKPENDCSCSERTHASREASSLWPTKTMLMLGTTEVVCSYGIASGSGERMSNPAAMKGRIYLGNSNTSVYQNTLTRLIVVCASRKAKPSSNMFTRYLRRIGEKSQARIQAIAKNILATQQERGDIVSSLAFLIINQHIIGI